MGRTVQIKIPVIVGSNGKWCANGYDSLKDPSKDADWGFMADSLDSSTPADKDPVWPAVERRYIVVATVEIPDETAATVEADDVIEVHQ